MTGFGKRTRRDFLRATAAVSAGLAATGAAGAQSSVMDILQSPRRGAWDDQFDASGARNKAAVNNRLPILSPATASYVEGAMIEYRNIVSRGGWPAVNARQALKVGVRDNAVSELRRRLIVSGDLPQRAGDSATFDTFLDGALKRFQERHGMVPDGVVGNYTLKALNVPADIRLGQLETNLVRLRAMSGFLGDRYIMVNIPAADIEAVRGERVDLRHKAIVGKVDRQTPILSSKVHQVILNPYWTAPKSIIRKDIIPLMRKDPTYLTRNKIRLFDNSGNEVPPEAVDWSTEDAVALRFRQDPGKINAMSSTKIDFYNPHAVYLHDTPQQSLFGKFLRFESSGCVRVHNIRELSSWILETETGWNRRQIERVIDSGVNTEIPVQVQVPIYMVYISAWSNNAGVVHFRDDIYARDGVRSLQLTQTAL